MNNVNVLLYLKKLNLKMYKLNDNNKNKIQTIYYLKKYLLNEWMNEWLKEGVNELNEWILDLVMRHDANLEKSSS